MQPIKGHSRGDLCKGWSGSTRRASSASQATNLSTELAVKPEIEDGKSTGTHVAELDCKAASLEEILKEKGECGVSATVTTCVLPQVDDDCCQFCVNIPHTLQYPSIPCDAGGFHCKLEE
jgi:hypothetical protein